MTIEHGIDVSHHQGVIDWTRVAAAPARIKFAFIKASQGVSFKDPRCAANIRQARAAGLQVGAYHYLSTRGLGGDQATQFLRVYRPEDGDLDPVLDVEEAAKGERFSAVRKRVTDWLRVVERELGRSADIYTTPAFATLMGFGEELASRRLWIAHLGVTEPRVPPPWSEWAIWQHSWTGRVDGVRGDVDLNCRRAAG